MYLFFYFTNIDIVACSSVIYHLQLVNLQQTTPLASRIMKKQQPVTHNIYKFYYKLK